MVNQRGYLQLEIVKNDNTYTFNIPTGSLLTEAQDALFEMLLVVKKSVDDQIEKEMLERSKKEVGKNSEKGEDSNSVEFKTDTCEETVKE